MFEIFTDSLCKDSFLFGSLVGGFLSAGFGVYFGYVVTKEIYLRRFEKFMSGFPGWSRKNLTLSKKDIQF